MPVSQKSKAYLQFVLKAKYLLSAGNATFTVPEITHYQTGVQLGLSHPFIWGGSCPELLHQLMEQISSVAEENILPQMLFRLEKKTFLKVCSNLAFYGNQGQDTFPRHFAIRHKLLARSKASEGVEPRGGISSLLVFLIRYSCHLCCCTKLIKLDVPYVTSAALEHYQRAHQHVCPSLNSNCILSPSLVWLLILGLKRQQCGKVRLGETGSKWKLVGEMQALFLLYLNGPNPLQGYGTGLCSLSCVT